MHNKDVKVVEIEGKRYIEYSSIFTDLTMGMIMRSHIQKDGIFEHDVVLLANVDSNDIWSCIIIHSDITNVPLIVKFRANDLENTDKFSTFSYIEYIELTV